MRINATHATTTLQSLCENNVNFGATFVCILVMSSYVGKCLYALAYDAVLSNLPPAAGSFKVAQDFLKIFCDFKIIERNLFFCKINQY